MARMDQIVEPIEVFLNEYKIFVDEALKSDDAYLSQICDYVLSNHGKRLRPTLSILTAALHGTPNKDLYSSSFLLEIVHTASLIHDDVVDEAYVRRGKASVNALWNPRTAVLVGDYLLSRALCHSLDRGLSKQVGMMCRAIYSASEGELSQSRRSETLNMDEQSYFDIIYKKTAILFGAAAASGALSTGADPKAIASMQSLGDNIGIAFQIRDDVLDYTADEAEMGKPQCCDLREKKITLPLLHLLDKASAERRAELLDRLSLVDSHPENIEYLRGEVVDCGGIEYANKIKGDYCDLAAKELDTYPDSPIKESLLLYIEAIRK